MYWHDKEYFKFVGQHPGYSKSILTTQADNIKGKRKKEINFITNIIMVEFDATLISTQHIRKRLLDSECRCLNIGSKL